MSWPFNELIESEREIFFVVFLKIQCFCFYRDSFTGVVFESSAGFVNRNDPLFNAKHKPIINFGAVAAILTRPWLLSAE